MVYHVLLKYKCSLVKDTLWEVSSWPSQQLDLPGRQLLLNHSGSSWAMSCCHFPPLSQGEAVYCVQWTFSHLAFNYYYFSTRWKRCCCHLPRSQFMKVLQPIPWKIFLKMLNTSQRKHFWTGKQANNTSPQTPFWKTTKQNPSKISKQQNWHICIIAKLCTSCKHPPPVQSWIA